MFSQQWCFWIVCAWWYQCFACTHSLLMMSIATRLPPRPTRIAGSNHHGGQLTAPPTRRPWVLQLARTVGDNDKESALREDAKAMLEKAKELRNQIEQSSLPSSGARAAGSRPMPAAPEGADAMMGGEDFRLYVDIGREEGSWMDSRWAASGRRIEFILDVRFLDRPADAEACGRIVADNMTGAKTIAKCLLVATHGRLNNGFNKMKCSHGAYRIDMSNNSDATNTVRFCIGTEGTLPKSATDVWIPNGDLHFSLPVFGKTPAQLSQKAGIVSVRQMGWNTGWRRVESRILGVFRAVRLDDAKQRDGF
jgi:hypothetical protein